MDYIRSIQIKQKVCVLIINSNFFFSKISCILCKRTKKKQEKSKLKFMKLGTYQFGVTADIKPDSRRAAHRRKRLAYLQFQTSGIEFLENGAKNIFG